MEKIKVEESIIEYVWRKQSEGMKEIYKKIEESFNCREIMKKIEKQFSHGRQYKS